LVVISLLIIVVIAVVIVMISVIIVMISVIIAMWVVVNSGLSGWINWSGHCKGCKGSAEDEGNLRELHVDGGALKKLMLWLIERLV